MPNPPGMYGLNNPNNGIDPNDPNYIKKVGNKNIAGLSQMAGNIAMPLIGLGTTMFQNNMRQMENNSLDYQAYQNDLLSSQQDINRGGGLQMLKMGGKIKPRLYPKGGLTDPELPTPVQLEKKEMIVTQDGDIYQSKSKELHKNMKKDEITDIAPSGSYVISNRSKLKKKDADKIILGINNLTYKETENKGEYKEHKLSDLFDKDEETLAELTMKLQKKYPTEMTPNKKGSIFGQRTIQENRASRANILAHLIELNESKKPNTQPSEEEVPLFPDGGIIGWDEKIRKERERLYPEEAEARKAREAQGFIDGQPISTPDQPRFIPPSIPMTPVTINPLTPADRTPTEVIPGGDSTQAIVTARPPSVKFDPSARTPPAIPLNPMSLIPGSSATVINNNISNQPNLLPPNEQLYKDALAQTDKELKGLDATYNANQRENNNAFFTNSAAVLGGTMVGLGGILGQNPRVESARLKNPNLPRELGQNYFNFVANQNNKNVRSMANAALSNTTDYSKAMNYILPVVGQATDANSQLAAQAGQMNLGLESQYQSALADTKNKQAVMDTAAYNETNKFINNLMSQSAGLGVNAINNLAGVNNQRVNLNNKNRSERSSRSSALQMQKLMIEYMRRGGTPPNFNSLQPTQ